MPGSIAGKLRRFERGSGTGRIKGLPCKAWQPFLFYEVRAEMGGEARNDRRIARAREKAAGMRPRGERIGEKTNGALKMSMVCVASELSIGIAGWRKCFCYSAIQMGWRAWANGMNRAIHRGIQPRRAILSEGRNDDGSENDADEKGKQGRGTVAGQEA